MDQLDERPQHRGSLHSRGFVALLATQFLGAFNDNMFRWFVVPLAQPIVGKAEALSLGLACFTVPYLLLATPAGFLADRLSKRTVIIGCKAAEVVIMLLGLAAVMTGSMPILFFVVTLMGCQSALFGPSKYGAIPDLLRSDKLSSGNGVMGLVTIAASALGVIAGRGLFEWMSIDSVSQITLATIWPAALALVGVALLGCLTSLPIPRLLPANLDRRLSWNLAGDTVDSLRQLVVRKSLLRSALGIAFFWFLASLAQLNIDLFGDLVLHLSSTRTSILLAVLVCGLGLGSVLAGWWSGGKIELGIVPLGATGIAISSLLVYATGVHVEATTAGQSFFWSCVWLGLLGISAGLFNIPLEAFLQEQAPAERRGTILAASNFLTFAFMIGASGLFWVFSDVLNFSPDQIFLVAGLGTIPVVVYVFRLLPDASIRFLVWLASHSVYRVRVRGRQNVPEVGGALLVANHVSWLDGILLLMCSSRRIRMLAYSDYIQGFGVAWLCRLFGVIPIRAEDGPKAIMRALKTARQAVLNGELVCIFAEGQITRTGQLLPFQRGLMRIIDRTDAPVIPVYLDELWGSIFSYRGGRIFWKRPERWPYPVSIWFGKPVFEPKTVEEVRLAVESLGVVAVSKRNSLVPQRQFVRKCRQGLFRPKVADSSGAELTGGKLLAATFVFRRHLESLLDDNEKNVGLLLPPSVGGFIANTSLALLNRVAVNLNYTLQEGDLNYCIRTAGIRRVLTSRRFLEKRPLELETEFVFLEDLKEKTTGWDRLRAALTAFLIPSFLIDRMCNLGSIKPSDLMTIIFTSGSTGEPKGVMLSHQNVGSNIEAVDHLFQISRNDAILGVLPFFHSFGYTLSLWLVATLDPKGAYHFNPLDSRTVGKLCEKHSVTFLLATPTFLKSYLKRCSKEQLAALDVAIVGAEKMPIELAQSFHDKFGVWPTEGYGATELSPLAAANVPDHRSVDSYQRGTKHGTVGRAVPGVSAKVVHPETRALLDPEEEGLLLIRGPNVMLGYLNQPEKSAELIVDGWYNTGDIAKIDAEGFIEITGRQSRFSKIGGEMVPHIRIEQELATIIGDTEDGELQVAVTSVPDDKKGERIVVLHRALPTSTDQILRQLSETGLPNLWIPAADSFIEVEQIPILGSGKLDLRALKQSALEAFQPETTKPAG